MSSFSQQDIIQWSCDDAYTLNLDPVNTNNGANDARNESVAGRNNFSGMPLNDANGQPGRYVIVDCPGDKYNASSLNAMTVVDVQTGEMAIIYQGSNGGTDWLTINAGNALGQHNPQYDDAVNYCKYVRSNLQNKTFSYIDPKTGQPATVQLGQVTAAGGNSLGGGDAVAVGLEFPDIMVISVNGAPMDRGRVQPGGDYSNIIQLRTDGDVLHRISEAGDRGDIFNYPGCIVQVNRGIFGANMDDIALQHRGAALGNEPQRISLANFVACDLVTGEILQGNGAAVVQLDLPQVKTMATNLGRYGENYRTEFDWISGQVDQLLNEDSFGRSGRFDSFTKQIRETVSGAIKGALPNALKNKLGGWCDTIGEAVSEDVNDILLLNLFREVGSSPSSLIEGFEKINQCFKENSEVLGKNVIALSCDIAQAAEIIEKVDNGAKPDSFSHREMLPLKLEFEDVSTIYTTNQVKSLREKACDYLYTGMIATLPIRIPAILAVHASVDLVVDHDIISFLTNAGLLTAYFGIGAINAWGEFLNFISWPVRELYALLTGRTINLNPFSIIEKIMGVSIPQLIVGVFVELKPVIMDLLMMESTAYLVGGYFSQLKELTCQEKLVLINSGNYLKNSVFGKAGESLYQLNSNIQKFADDLEAVISITAN